LSERRGSALFTISLIDIHPPPLQFGGFEEGKGSGSLSRNIRIDRLARRKEQDGLPNWGVRLFSLHQEGSKPYKHLLSNRKFSRFFRPLPNSKEEEKKKGAVIKQWEKKLLIR